MVPQKSDHWSHASWLSPPLQHFFLATRQHVSHPNKKPERLGQKNEEWTEKQNRRIYYNELT
jgi:hypothetical protein